MTITQETSEKMEITDNNMAGLIGGSGIIFSGFIILLVNGMSIKTAWFPLILIVVGCIMLAFSNFRKILIDKQKKKIFFQIKSILGTKRNELPLDDIVKLELRGEYLMESSIRKNGSFISLPQLTYHLVFLSYDGRETAFDQLKSEIDGSNPAQIEAYECIIGQKIAQFLNVPFEEIAAAQPISTSRPAVH